MANLDASNDQAFETIVWLGWLMHFVFVFLYMYSAWSEESALNARLMLQIHATDTEKIHAACQTDTVRQTGAACQTDAVAKATETEKIHAECQTTETEKIHAECQTKETKKPEPGSATNAKETKKPETGAVAKATETEKPETGAATNAKETKKPEACTVLCAIAIATPNDINYDLPVLPSVQNDIEMVVKFALGQPALLKTIVISDCVSETTKACAKNGKMDFFNGTLPGWNGGIDAVKNVQGKKNVVLLFMGHGFISKKSSSYCFPLNDSHRLTRMGIHQAFIAIANTMQVQPNIWKNRIHAVFDTCHGHAAAGPMSPGGVIIIQRSGMKRLPEQSSIRRRNVTSAVTLANCNAEVTFLTTQTVSGDVYDLEVPCGDPPGTKHTGFLCHQIFHGEANIARHILFDFSDFVTYIQMFKALWMGADEVQKYPADHQKEPRKLHITTSAVLTDWHARFRK
jgi:hypothetical protein